ncbi:MAG TPA: molybdenum cofactor biosynthesis protein MoaE [Rhizomicrobium sp.]|jgi:molybdopterin synthase catalytic subunit|nr:molybdenum cofactor biosynthesis protein MoaE [Rhizomicrobium sp.]
MRTLRIQTEDFDPGAEIRALAAGRAEVGAIVAFAGLVRGDDGLSALTLEHYPGMTQREIARHIEEAEERWPILGTTVIHRVGRLCPGQRIVLVAVASAHRRAAFEAAEFLMDYLKTRAPFWKQEHHGTETKWSEARRDDEVAAIRWNPA